MLRPLINCAVLSDIFCGRAIFRQYVPKINRLKGSNIDKIKYRLNGRCSNNQAEQLAILKALENIQNLDTNEKTVQVFTDSRITLDALKNRKNHAHLIEQIRTKVIEMEN